MIADDLWNTLYPGPRCNLRWNYFDAISCYGIGLDSYYDDDRNLRERPIENMNLTEVANLAIPTYIKWLTEVEDCGLDFFWPLMAQYDDDHVDLECDNIPDRDPYGEFYSDSKPDFAYFAQGIKNCINSYGYPFVSVTSFNEWYETSSVEACSTPGEDYRYNWGWDFLDVLRETFSSGVSETITTPYTPSGPAIGYTNTSYTYTTGGATSNLGHSVQYLFDWGDGTDSGWLPVGTTFASHSWSSPGTYNVKVKARCAEHNSVESQWSSVVSVGVVIYNNYNYDNSPSNYQIIPEVIWAPATGGGEWVTEVQIVDISGGSSVQVYFNYGGGSRRGPITLWVNSGEPGRSIKFPNFLSTLQNLDPSFTYYGKVGAVEFLTQDSNHRIQVVARTFNGNFSKTFPGLNDVASNTADTTRWMIIMNVASNATYRTSVGCFNPSDSTITVEFKIIDSNGGQIGSTVTRTLAGKDFQAFNIFSEAGVPYPSYSYDNTWVLIRPISGTGRVMVFGATANNYTNDPAAHIAQQLSSGYYNSPSNYQILPEVIWAPATGGGEWVTEVQIIDISGGSSVSVYFNYGGGGRRGPFTVWTNSGGANRCVKFANFLSTLQSLDPSFSYYGKAGAVEFMTQDSAHKIQVTARILTGNYSKTFPGLNLVEANFADIARQMMIQNLTNNDLYRSSAGFFNPSPNPVTVEFRLVDTNGNLIGSSFTKTIVGFDFQTFNPFSEAGVSYPSYSYDNVWLWIRPISDGGKVICFGATANNYTNDPAAHISVQFQ